ncbi:hypothetical protein FNB15_11280 [Ferrovibrio terrae]|uniref:CMP/dCMP-type deaminase domain-containing protein n=1 Tax=Ferrovibrio terrae TaxID=2594003 RepID=A0A516H214_9PROT|nr:deaminase [Ferrovibrio terrae]QDO97813.1 hypothetical protein FNB15_11280 [Ferrovibrio terrae]
MKPKVFLNQTEADRHYLWRAVLESSKSEDPKAKLTATSAVGAVIADNNSVIAASANVLPYKLKEAFKKSRKRVTLQNREFVIEHAERAAIYKMLLDGRSPSGATLYCTRFPCSDCARAIVTAGIRRIVLAQGFGKDKSHWRHQQRAAKDLLIDSGVKIRFFKL